CSLNTLRSKITRYSDLSICPPEDRQVNSVNPTKLCISAEIARSKCQLRKERKIEVCLNDVNTSSVEIAFSAALFQPGKGGNVGPFTTEITLIYRNVFTNIGNAYNPTTGIFTAPLKGAYMFNFSVYGHWNPSTPSTVSIVKNEQRVVVAHGHQDQYAVNSSKGVVLILEVGDVVYVRLWSGRKIYDNEHNHITFSGYLLFPLR
uniref:C1q domain-containing protein n=1 Tax=Sinocyclocheilus grahami TaxID=75366 RepID=A0A672M985_SINGR